jgi:hypothetical protein
MATRGGRGNTGSVTVIKRFTLIDPGKWPPRKSGKPRVLLEHPDHAVLWDSAKTLRDAGYEVRICGGPDADHSCPLVEFGSCTLVDDADVIVSSTRLWSSKEILDVYSRGITPKLVVEAGSDELEELAERLPDAVFLPRPFSQHGLRAAVSRAEIRPG